MFVFIVFALISFMPRLYSATPYFNARSQSARLPLELVGQCNYLNRYQPEKNYTNLSFSAAFSQSFRNEDSACCLFGPDLVKSGDCTQLTISGSGRSDRGDNDWFADYFGLPSDFKSTVQFSPRVRNIMIDGSFYFGLDEWWHPGMYFKMHAPFVHTRWELGFCEKVCDAGKADHLPGYFNSNGGTVGVARGKLLKSFEEFAVQCKVPDINPDLTLPDDSSPVGPLLSPVVFKPLTSARMAGCDCSPLTRSGLADLRFTLGYNPYISEKFHVGFGLSGAAPTGNRPHGEFVFEPMVGNGNHWELGGELTAHYQFWQSDDEESRVTGHLNAHLTHMFTTRQTRTFDLKGKPNSRYMLAQKMGLPSCGLVVGEYNKVGDAFLVLHTLNFIASFKDVFMPVANVTTVDVDVNVGAHVDMVLMLNYTAQNVSFDFGYNLWARSCERIKLNCKCPNQLTDGKTWALKGDAHVYGFGQDSSNGGKTFAVGLSATQSSATMHSGTNKDSATQDFTADRNPGIDSRQFAFFVRNGSSSGIALSSSNSEAMQGSPKGMLTSKSPVFITEGDLDLASAATKGLSHTLFAHVSYQWTQRKEYTPFLGGGFSVEFADSSDGCCPAKNSRSNCAKSCRSGCTRCGLSQWAVWLKGGFAFN